MKVYKLATSCIEYDESTEYWTDGKTVNCCRYKIAEADIESFEHFPGDWAKDKKHCYSVSKRLRGADPATFEVVVIPEVAAGTPYQLARDKNFGYVNDKVLPHEELDKMARERLEFYEQWKKEFGTPRVL